MSSPHPFVRLVALAALGLALTGGIGHATADAAPSGCDGPSLPLVWIDGGGLTSPAVLAEAEREVARIWAPAGITFDWERTVPGRAPRAGEVLVMVREQLAGRPHTGLRARRRVTLGRVIRVSADRPSRLIELAMPAISTSVLPQVLFGQTIRDLPEALRTLAMGRGLGRVLAHEIGHWLFGSAHTAAGLMRPSLKGRDLVASTAPGLPPAWPPLARDRLLARRACAPPCPPRQPVTEEGTASCR
jgi:hypothetical protein